MDIQRIRLHHLRRLMTRYESQVAFAFAIGQSAQYVNQLLTGQRNLGEKTARKIEQALGLPLGQLDQDLTVLADAGRAAGLLEDQQTLVQDYARLSPQHQHIIRETVRAYLALEQAS